MQVIKFPTQSQHASAHFQGRERNGTHWAYVCLATRDGRMSLNYSLSGTQIAHYGHGINSDALYVGTLCKAFFQCTSELTRNRCVNDRESGNSVFVYTPNTYKHNFACQNCRSNIITAAHHLRQSAAICDFQQRGSTRKMGQLIPSRRLWAHRRSSEYELYRREDNTPTSLAPVNLDGLPSPQLLALLLLPPTPRPPPTPTQWTITSSIDESS